MTGLRVLVADDSVVARRLIATVLDADDHVAAVETVANGRLALMRLSSFAPDVVILDVEMPELDGLATLTQLRSVRPDLPVVMCSALTGRGARVAFEALRMGAVECVGKPAGVDRGAAAAALETELLPVLQRVARSRTPPPTVGAPRPRPARSSKAADLVVIGVSTGGPDALAAVIPRLPADLGVPVLVAQHLPGPFTGMLADRLARSSTLPVREAVDGAALAPGQVWIAPGGRHLAVRASAAMPGAVRLVVHDGPAVNGCRPSVDVLLDAVVDEVGGTALAVVMTGMGRDGLHGSARLRAAGGRVVAQDEASSVVWGMPGAVVGAGLADAVVPLDGLAAAIAARVPQARLA